MEIQKDVIYLDQKGYQELLSGIQKLKEELNQNNIGRKEAFDAGAGDGWDSPEFEEIQRKEMLIIGELERKYDELSRVVLVEKHNDSEIIDIGDVLLADLHFSDDSEELVFELVGTSGNLNAEIQQVSINSPLGNAVYRKKIGDKCSYSLNNETVDVLIKQKLDLSKENDESKEKTIK